MPWDQAGHRPTLKGDSLRLSSPVIQGNPVPLASRDAIATALSHIAEAAVLAPSADNHHSFRLRPLQSGVDLEATEAFLEAPFHRRVLSLISYGAAVENMILRAAHLGIVARARWLPDPTRPELIAEIALSPGEKSANPLEAAIPERHTNRSLAFSGPPLSAAAIGAYTELVEAVGGISLLWFAEAARRSTLLSLIRKAETERFQNPKLHADLFGSIRFDVGWSATTDEGLPPAALGVEPGLKWMFSQLRHWSVMRVLNWVGGSHALGFRAAHLPCKLAPHLGVLVAHVPLEEGAFRAGCALERVWLKATADGLAFQPLAAAALLALPGYREVSSEVGDQLRAGWRTLTDATPLMVFRMGRARPPKVRTSRRPSSTYVAGP
jgi:hypothetical protein